MALVTGVVLPNNGDRIKVENYNDPINKILAQVNGNLDDSNISGLNGSKLAAGSVPLSALTTAATQSIAQGWNDLGATPSSTIYNGNGSYTSTFAADQRPKVSPGDRFRFTRSVVSPIQSTSLNGTNQYFVKTAPNKLTFTDDFAVSAWVKLANYSVGDINIVSRFNGTSGWVLRTTSDGRPLLIGFNGGGANFSYVISNQSLPLNKWIHITAQLDMSSFTVSPTTSYIMFDGVDTPCTLTRAGTNPVALVQAGNLEIGSANAAGFWPGKIAQVAIFNNKITQSTARSYISQGLLGTEPNLASAFSLSGNSNDLSVATPNDLTPAGAATTTNADAPFGMQGDATFSTTLEYGIAMNTTASTITFQSPEGGAIPTNGISKVEFSSVKTPYNFPSQQAKWNIETLMFFSPNAASAASPVWFGHQITAPIGEWEMGYDADFLLALSGSGVINARFDLNEAKATSSTQSAFAASSTAVNLQELYPHVTKSGFISRQTQTVYYLNGSPIGSSFTSFGVRPLSGLNTIRLRNSYL